MRFFFTLFLLCLLAAAQAQCLTANATSQNGTANSTSPVAVRANRAAEVSGNITNVPILTPFPSLTLNASQIGCPEENGVCSVVDFKLSASHAHPLLDLLTVPLLSLSDLSHSLSHLYFSHSPHLLLAASLASSVSC